MAHSFLDRTTQVKATTVAEYTTLSLYRTTQVKATTVAEWLLIHLIAETSVNTLISNANC